MLLYLGDDLSYEPQSKLVFGPFEGTCTSAEWLEHPSSIMDIYRVFGFTTIVYIGPVSGYKLQVSSEDEVQQWLSDVDSQSQAEPNGFHRYSLGN